MARRVVLIGGGHAHVEVIRRWASNPPPDAELTVIDPSLRPVYSGMVPGFVAGQYQASELEIDLSALCDAAGARVCNDEAVAVDASAQVVRLSVGGEVAYDVASLDIGSTVAGSDTPGVREYALRSRPIASLVAEIGSMLAPTRGSEGPASFRVHVVGGGAAGVELAFCLEGRLRREADVAYCVDIVTDAERLLPGAPVRAVQRVEAAARARGIAFRLGESVVSVARDRLDLGSGESIESDAVVWVTGPAAHDLAAKSGLPVDSAGYVRIGETFRVDGFDTLFAVGDCASLPGMGRAGVYAVRAGPLLDHNLRAVLSGEPLRSYRPQSDFLSILNLGDGTAIGHKWGFVFAGAWVMRLKDRIDRAFMRRYHAAQL